ncbi:MAG: Hsp70 family protein [Syntrophomonas sp.]
MHLGIDFGTSYTKLGYWEDDHFTNLAGSEQRIPSVVAWLPSQPGLFFGNRAYRLEEPGAVRVGFFKLALKRNPDFTLGAFTLPHIMREFFNFLKQNYLACVSLKPLESISLSVPNYFGLNSRRILLEAARKVFGVKNIYLLPEPVAAVSGYNYSHPDNPLQGDILSIDIGGGTSDFSFLRLMQDSREILLETQLQIGHDAFSGLEIDRNILHHIFFPGYHMQHGETLPETFWTENFNSSRDKYIFNQLMMQAEKFKIAMSCREQCSLDIPDFYRGKSLQLKIDQNMFILQLHDVFERLQIFLTESLKTRAQNLGLYNGQHWQLDYVLLQGGASRCHGVREMIEEFFTGVMVIQPEDVDFNVVRGLSLWNESMAASSRVKSIYPFQFYIARLDPLNKNPDLEKIKFDTSNLELDIRGRYKIFSFSPDSNYNLAVDNGMVSCKIYEVEEADNHVELARFQGQELVWRLESLREQAPQTVNIYLDMANSQLASSDIAEAMPGGESKHSELLKNYLLSEQIALGWISSYPLARQPLLSDFKSHLSKQEVKADLPWHHHAQTTRYKLLCLLDFLTRS